MKVAQVGAHKRRTDGDITRWLTAVDWLMKNNGHLDWSTSKHDVVNLKYKRDFLQEHEQYDIVVMHDIYDGAWDMKRAAEILQISAKQMKNYKEQLQTSPLQSDFRWRYRLANSGAKYIFIFELSPACVNGWKLGYIPGYTVAYKSTEYTVFVKEELHDPEG